MYSALLLLSIILLRLSQETPCQTAKFPLIIGSGTEITEIRDIDFNPATDRLFVVGGTNDPALHSIVGDTSNRYPFIGHYH